jgi:hypothetical protein
MGRLISVCPSPCRSDEGAESVVSCGRDFRHEKTKKKRGSYRGGNIDPHATFSIKFESDED